MFDFSCFMDDFPMKLSDAFRALHVEEWCVSKWCLVSGSDSSVVWRAVQKSLGFQWINMDKYEKKDKYEKYG